MEKVKIAEIDIGVDKLVAKTGEVKQEIERLRKSQKDLKKDTDGLTGATKEQLAEYTKAEIEIKNLNKEYRASNKVLDAYINIQNQEIHTINEARDANLKLIAIKNELDTENEDHIKLIKKINAEVDSNTDYIKENSSEYEKTKINIGNYKEAITGALGELGIFGQYQKGVNDVMKGSGPIITFVSTNLKQVKDDFVKASAATTGMSKAQVAAHLTSTALTAGLKILRIALIATGIGAIVVVLGSFIAYLATTQEGINKVNMVLTPLKEGFNAVLGSVQDLGKAFSKLFTLDFSGFLGDIKKIGGEMKSNIKEAVERGKEMETIQQNLNKKEADYITLQAKLKKEFEQQKKLSDDTTKSTEEREKAAEKAIELQKEISKGSIERIKQEAQILKLKQMSNDTSDAERAELAIKLAEIDKALQEEATKTTEAQNKLNAIRKQNSDKQAADAKASLDKQTAAYQTYVQGKLKSLEEETALYAEQQRFNQETDKERLTFMMNQADKEKGILDYKLKNKLISETEYQTSVLKLENDLVANKAEIAQKELDRIEDFENRKKSLVDQLYLDSLANEQERERARLDQEYANKAAEIERLIENDAQKTELILLLEEEKNNRLNEIKTKHAEKAIQEEQKRADAEIQISQELANAKSSIAQGLAGLLNAVAGENAKVQIATLLIEKGIAASQVILQTQIANAKALAASPLTFGQPFVGYNFVQMGLSLATIATQSFTGVKNIKQSKTPKAAQGIGMDINGPSHSQGGVTLFDKNGNPLVEAQGGEKMVILKREASAELSALSALNQKHGGVSLSKPVSYAANGGSIIRNPQSATRVSNFQMDYQKMSELVSNAVAEKVNSIQTVIPVDQITNVAIKAARVERGANL